MATAEPGAGSATPAGDYAKVKSSATDAVSTAPAAPAFIAAAKFEGSKPGYAFSKGKLGLGYYKDEKKQVAPPQQQNSLLTVDTSTKCWMYYGVPSTAGADGANNSAHGPVALETLRTTPRQNAYMVWKQGLNAWAERDKVVELQHWIYLDAKTGAQVGPLWVEDLAKLYEAGTIERTTQLWCEGMAEWKPLILLDELQAYLDGLVAAVAPAIPQLEGPVGETHENSSKKQNKPSDAATKDSKEGGPQPTKRKVDAVYHGPQAGEAQSYVAEDGTTYTWDEETKKWIATPGDKPAGEAPKPKKKRKKKKKKKKANDCLVYIEGFDPKTIDEQQIEKIFSKYGIIKTNMFTGGPSITLYRNDDKEESIKGDATVCFLKKESAELAIRLMDDFEYKPGFRISVKKAWTRPDQGKAGDGPRRKRPPQMQMTQTELNQLKKQIQARERKLLSWADGPEEDDMNIVILKHCFTPSELEDEAVETDLKKDLKEGCEKAGKVLKVSLMKFNPEGVAIVKFEDAAAANACVKQLNGRSFNKRRLDVSIWDGVTVYYVKESEESKQKRINDFGKWLEGEGEGDEEEKESGAAADKTVAPAGVVLTGLSPEGKAVSAAANQLLATASDEMLAPFIKAWLKANPKPPAAEANKRKEALTNNAIIARILATME